MRRIYRLLLLSVSLPVAALRAAPGSSPTRLYASSLAAPHLTRHAVQQAMLQNSQSEFDLAKERHAEMARCRFG